MAVISWTIVLIFDVQKTKKLAHFTVYSMKKILSLLKLCFPLMIVLLCGIIIVSFTRFSITRMYGDISLGIYATVTTPVMIIQVGISVLFAPLTNLFTVYLKEGDKAKFVKVFFLVFVFILIVTLVFILLFHFFGGWGLGILFEDSIVPYAYLLPGAVIIAGLTASLWFLNVVFSAIRDIRGLFFGNIAGVAVCFATVNLLLTRYELMGANYVQIISMGVVTLCLLLRLFWYISKKKELFMQQTGKK